MQVIFKSITKTMESFIKIIFLLSVVIGCSEESTSPPKDDFKIVEYDPVSVPKTNQTKIYMHYMPWFSSPEENGSWGIHWTMANRNPDIIDSDGKREIASHFYPLIGPYSSTDKDVIEYHLLLMKLCGIDGVLIDWYGSFDVYDFGQNLVNSEALIDRLDETGLDFGIVYEEYTCESVAKQNKSETPIQAAKADLLYMANNYFSNSNYITIDGTPLLLTFGPRFFKKESDWTQIFEDINPKPVFLTLMNQSGDAGINADGEFAWVIRSYLMELSFFYSSRAVSFKSSMSAAFPGFYDFYSEGGWSDHHLNWDINYNGTSTLSTTLRQAEQSGLEMLQLVTWNDFGEGTMLEPTLEFGYTFLETIQQFAGVSYNKNDLEMIFRLYKYRKQFANDEERQLKLDQVFYYLVSLHIEEAGNLLDEIE
ncbi:MAG: hypothetical protein JEY94_05830 [Melioribacteraceae bacterium]|nr:hypothetical protein [Melioribacteraceae bacterium]